MKQLLLFKKDELGYREYLLGILSWIGIIAAVCGLLYLVDYAGGEPSDVVGRENGKSYTPAHTNIIWHHDPHCTYATTQYIPDQWTVYVNVSGVDLFVRSRPAHI